MKNAFDERTRRLILAAEIAGYLHDLGKLHPDFAGEMLGDGKNLGDETRDSCGIQVAHGAILEAGRAYPRTAEMAKKPDLAGVLAGLLADLAWAEALAIPASWLRPGAVQASGLGAALRQHHAGNEFPAEQLSFLGDLYSFGADIRDSALDKASGVAEGGRQATAHAEIADAFGQMRAPYSTERLAAVWDDAIAVIKAHVFSPAATQDIAVTRRRLLAELQPIFSRALGETRRPTNDVTLWHHAHSSASFFKAAVAEGALRAEVNFKPLQTDKGAFDLAQLGRVRFRLLGVRWDWQALTRGMLTTTALVSLSHLRREVVDDLRELFEERSPVGNLIYEDDDGVLVLAPGFQEDEAARSDALFARHLLDPLQEAIAECIEPLGVGTPFRLCWSAPALYLTDYAEALGLHADSCCQRHLQAGEEKLRVLWESANAEQGKLIQICPQCGLRPAETREYALTESRSRAQPLCDDCTALADRDAKRSRVRHLAADFGFRSRISTMEELADEGDSSRMALLSVQVDAGAIASGTSLITQLARPVASVRSALTAEDEKQKGNNKNHKSADISWLIDSNALGNWFEKRLDDLHAGKLPSKDDANLARSLLGETFWLTKKDGRSAAPDAVHKALEVAEDFLLRESAALPEAWRLARHDGDRLALFAMRKHASPARLQRLWDDLRALWQELANEVAGTLDDRLLPLTLDARGLRFIVSAADADATVAIIGRLLAQRLSKVRGGLSAHVSCAVMRAKFPLYIALDVLGRLDARVPQVPHQTWRVESARTAADGRTVDLIWATPQGLVAWQVDTATDDPGQSDMWHPHVIAVTRAGKPVSGPQRLTHVLDLLPGDEVLIPPMTFDFMVLEGSARRHQLAYRRDGEEVRRPHWVMDDAGRSPLLLEGFAEFSRLVADSGWDTSKIKGLQGEMVETYEKWVRDVPAALRPAGRDAWHAHLRNILLRYVTGDDAPARRERLFNAIIDGRFFDAVEWSTFVSRTHRSLSEENA
ncbi:hypothetical protein [Candidatus Accumulibacter vicinus]|uniref:CRISPR-associated protein, Csx11 family n=1 Tax=Candidatus Accumulibacter vicinus TaxID=2954382 RepID=A0A084XYU2_9PROT|nr:hypothetical protein [Candidatus Accumulibacter vicinus]KFB67636.1 MAG: CRISPR-associated protein, Csx11 family [Candidatus Accumulibacter vicinus]